CNAQDIQWLSETYSALAFPRKLPPQDPALLVSTPLYYHVVLSERWRVPAPTAESLDAFANNVAIASGFGELARAYDTWPRYPIDQFARTWATTSAPILIMSGGLDVQTLAADGERASKSIQSPHIHYAYVPNGNHAVLTQSPLPNETTQCGEKILMSFMARP